MYIDINSILVIANIVIVSLLLIIGTLILVVNRKVKKDQEKIKNQAGNNKLDYDVESAKLKLPSTPIYLNDFDKLIVPVVYLINQAVESAVTKFKAEAGRKSRNGVVEYYVSQENAEAIVQNVCHSVRESLSDEFILSMNRYLSIEGFGKFVNEIVLQKVYHVVKELNTTVYNPQVKESLKKGKEKRELKEMPNEVVQRMASMAGLTAQDIEKMNSTDELYSSVFKGLNSMN